MARQSRWIVREMRCPEGKGETKLLLEWSFGRGKETLCSISCSNTCLKDLCGGDCRWSCWDEVTRGRERHSTDLHNA